MKKIVLAVGILGMLNNASSHALHWRKISVYLHEDACDEIAVSVAPYDPSGANGEMTLLKKGQLHTMMVGKQISVELFHKHTVENNVMTEKITRHSMVREIDQSTISLGLSPSKDAEQNARLKIAIQQNTLEHQMVAFIKNLFGGQ